MYTKRGQLTLFVIIAIVLVVGILVYFFVPNSVFGLNRGAGFTFDSCVSDAADELIVSLAVQGGGLDDGERGFLYRDIELPYYCYTALPYVTCTVQRPLLKQDFERRFAAALLPEVNSCYESALSDLRDSGYEVRSGKVFLNTTFIPGRLLIDIDAPTTVEGQRFISYGVSLDTSMYDMLMVATSIVQYEAALGDSSVDQYMLYYPNFIVRKLKQGDSTTVYEITDKSNDLTLSFVSKSLVWPAGYDLVEGGNNG